MNKCFIPFKACLCHEEGIRDDSCGDDTGICSCKPNFSGEKCDFCLPGFYGFPNCSGWFIYKYKV